MSELSIVDPAPVMDVPSSDTSPSRGSEPASSSPPSSKTSVEDLTAMDSDDSQRQLDDDENPNLPEVTRSKLRRQRYQRGVEKRAQKKAQQRAGEAEAERWLRKEFPEDKPVRESNLSESSRAPERAAAPDRSDEEQEQTQHDAAQHDEAHDEQYEGEQPEETTQQVEATDWAESAEEILARATQEGQEAQQHRDRRIEVAAAFRERMKVTAAHFKDYHEVIVQAPPVPLSDAVVEQLQESPAGTILQYALAKRNADGSPRSELMALANASWHAPKEAERMIAKWEGYIESMARQHRAQPGPRLVTAAPKPITPLRGGGASPPSADGEVNAYIKKTYGNRG